MCLYMQARLCGSTSFMAYISASIMEDSSVQQDISVGAVYTQDISVGAVYTQDIPVGAVYTQPL